jgi:hypothetical protein
MRELTSAEIGCVSGGNADFIGCMNNNWAHNTIVGATTGAFVGGVGGGILGAMGGSTGTFFYCVIA